MNVPIAPCCKEPWLGRMKDAIQYSREIGKGMSSKNLHWDDESIHGQILIDHTMEDLSHHAFAHI